MLSRTKYGVKKLGYLKTHKFGGVFQSMKIVKRENSTVSLCLNFR